MMFLEGISTTEYILVFLAILLVVYYYYATSYHGIWERYGVPGPKPLPIFDHMLELRKNGYTATINKWFKQYGKTFGAYGLQPHMPTLVTKDLELAKQVLVKDFDNFMERYRPRPTKASVRNALSSHYGGKWRRQRHVTSPMFTGTKMKMMMEHVNASAETLTALGRKYLAKNELIPVKDFTMKFASEVIARVGFGVTTHQATEEESEFAYHCRTLVIVQNFWTKLATKLSYFFPFTYTILHMLTTKADFINFESDNYFTNILKSTMQDRKRERVKKPESRRKARDMLDLMMEAEVDKEDPRLKDMDSKAINEDEIIGNSTVLILAGVETVSISFQSILYCLAVHQEVQDKVIEEIESVVPGDQNVEYEHLAQLKYTEQVINECLRLFPLLATLFRKAADTKTYNGITIPKGTVVQIPIGMIMKDPEYWPDPDKFDPDRFAPEKKNDRDQISFLPFGFGPRICLGQRLAMMELKTILVKLLKELKFVLSERTEPPKGEAMKMEFIDGTFFRHEKPVMIDVVARN